LIAILKAAGGQGVAFGLAAALTLSGLPHISNAQVSKNLRVAGLEGSWSGGGTVTFASGSNGAGGQARTAKRLMPPALWPREGLRKRLGCAKSAITDIPAISTIANIRSRA